MSKSPINDKNDESHSQTREYYQMTKCWGSGGVPVSQLGPRVRFPWPLIVLEIFMQFSSQKLHRRSPATSFWKERSEAQISNIFIGPEIFSFCSHWSTWGASTPAMFTPLLLTRSFKVSDTQVKAFFFKPFCFSWTQAWTELNSIFSNM